MQTVFPRFLQTPACHDGCEEEEQACRQAPMRNAARTRRARFVVPLPPSPSAPTQATPAKLSCPVLNPPALSRFPCGTCTAPSVGAGWVPFHRDKSGFHGVELCSTSSSLRQAPHRLFRQQHSRPHRLRGTSSRPAGPLIPPSAGERHAEGVPHQQDNVWPQATSITQFFQSSKPF
jgi:hypothetical protein